MTAIDPSRLRNLLGRTSNVLRRRGFGYLARLTTGYLAPAAIYRIREHRDRAAAVLVAAAALTTGGLAVRYDARRVIRALSGLALPAGLCWLAARRLALAQRSARARALTGLRHTPPEDPRQPAPGGSPVTSTSISETLGVQRSFGRDAAAFIAEWLSLVTARGIAGVPALLAVDEGGRRLVRRFIPGSPLADLLRDGRNPGDADGALSRLEHLIEALHRVGITGFGISPDDVVIDRLGAPWLVNFRHAQVHRSTETLAFVFARDNDRVAFNRLYRRNLLTEAGARLALAQTGATLPWGWYAAIDFGHGLAVSGVSGIWSTDIGVGRWEFFNRHVVAPLVRGGRVLDLGSNNGLLPMMMLRAGAREVLGVEVSKPYVKAAELVRRVFEWRDMRPYALRIHHGTMLDTLNHDWGTFDVATAFCSLYYLSAEEMAAVVRRAAQIAPVMVLQANEGMPGNSPDNRAERATAVYLHRLLQQNGLPRTRIHAPSGYARPLVVGRRTEGA